MAKFPHYHRDKRRALHDLYAPLNPKLGAEIGVWKGNTSRSLLNRFPDLTLYMIDRWKPPQKGDSWLTTEDRFAKHSAAEFTDAFNGAMKVTHPYQHRCRVWMLESIEAAKNVADGTLDFVFIDGDHSSVGTFVDIDAWYDKVKSGGIISGHDYGEGHDLGYGVADAVKNFFGTEGYEVLTDTFIWHVTKP